MTTDITKRNFLKSITLSSYYPLNYKLNQESLDNESAAPVNVIIPEDYNPPIDGESQLRLKKATLNFFAENYQNVNLAFWNVKLAEIDLEKRIDNIIFWLAAAIEEHKNIYPVDPAWAIAQIMAESFFYEFAVSNDLAVGICQIIPNTAKSYNMVYAGSLPEHHKAPYLLPEYANAVNDFHRLRNQKRNYIRNNKPDDLFTLEETLEIIAQNSNSEMYIARSEQHLNFLAKLKEFDEKISLSIKQYKEYLEANIKRAEKNKDIFEETDFFVGFDERFTYKKSISVMIDMLARGLKARNGNILTAAAGYNAGLRSTYIDEKVYRLYGKIPSNNETTIYLSRIIGNHHEIMKRMG